MNNKFNMHHHGSIGRLGDQFSSKHLYHYRHAVRCTQNRYCRRSTHSHSVLFAAEGCVRRLQVHADRQLPCCGRLAALCNSATSVRKYIPSLPDDKVAFKRYQNDPVLNNHRTLQARGLLHSRKQRCHSGCQHHQIR